ncbi:MAG TPA: hypothetical protein VIM89_18490 [Mucilaginibacter sp.]
MKRLILAILFSGFYLLTSNYVCAQSSINYDRAKKLSDSALMLEATQPSLDAESLYEKKIELINQAIKIDSNYFLAYSDRFMVEFEHKKYNEAILTGKQMIRIEPTNPDLEIDVGGVCENNNDTSSAIQHYKQGLAKYNRILDTISVKNKKRSEYEAGRAIAFILLGDEQKGRTLLKELYDKATDDAEKWALRNFISAPRKFFVY